MPSLARQEPVGKSACDIRLLLFRRSHFAHQGAFFFTHHQQAQFGHVPQFIGIQAYVVKFTAQIRVAILEEFYLTVS